MYTKHDELDKELDFQMHLHEPRRMPIDKAVHNIRAGTLVLKITTNRIPMSLLN